MNFYKKAKKIKNVIFLSNLLILQFFIFYWVIKKFEWFDQYQAQFYGFTSNFFRILFNYVSFSLGDLLYLLLILFLIYLLFKLIKKKIYFVLTRILISMNLIYFIFSFFWRLNYQRIPLSEKLNFTYQLSDNKELYELSKVLIKKCERLRISLKEEKGPFTFDQIHLKGLQKGFLYLENLNMVLHAKNLSIKPSLFSFFLKYSSITGYYNPFTFEAQVNFGMPKINIPFTTSHEMAHQVGIAREEEANFIGFLASVFSLDPAYKYSAYYNALKYVLNELMLDDKFDKKSISLFSALKKDLEMEREFYEKHKSILSDITRYFNDLFLKFNGQKSGIKSYNYFVKLLIGQYQQEKTGKSIMKVFL